MKHIKHTVKHFEEQISKLAENLSKPKHFTIYHDNADYDYVSICIMFFKRRYYILNLRFGGTNSYTKKEFFNSYEWGCISSEAWKANTYEFESIEQMDKQIESDHPCDQEWPGDEAIEEFRKMTKL